MLLVDVTTRFDSWISTTFSEKTEIKNYLLRHERKKVCLENLCAQILRAEAKVRVRMDQAKFHALIDTTARMFCKAAIDSRVAYLASDAEKSRLQRVVDNEQEMEKIVSETVKEIQPDGSLKPL